MQLFAPYDNLEEEKREKPKKVEEATRKVDKAAKKNHRKLQTN